MLLYCSVWPLNGVLAVESKSVSDCQLRHTARSTMRRPQHQEANWAILGRMSSSSFLRRETQPVIRSRDTEFRSTRRKLL
ncbi:hypothetical protein BKA82DRAFT_1001496, partial [Pisolithus tinctorius]